MASHSSKIQGASCAMSGHVAYTAQQIAFFGMVDRRINKRAAQLQAGLIVPKQARNPMRADKTPRKPEDGHFDYSIPAGPKDLKDWDRWQYPESDFGIMGKFASQKNTYANFIGTLDDYRNNIARAEEERAAAEAAAAAAAATSRAPQQTSRYSAREEHPSSARDGQQRMSARLGLGQPAEGGIEAHSIKTFKVLGGPHPEVLENWRAKRAAEFLKKKPHPLDPPPKKSLDHTLPMLPPGYYHDAHPDYGDVNFSPSKPHKKVLGALVPHGKTTDINSMKESLTGLMDALDQTEKDLKRQELVLGLNARKKKAYEAPAAAAAAASGRRGS